MIYKGSDVVEDVYVGDQPISEVYHGNTLVYNKRKFLAAAITYTPGISDGQGGFVRVNNNTTQYPIRCLCLIRSDGYAAAIPFAMWNDSVNLAPTDAQIANANWVQGDYPLTYNGGTATALNSSVFIPAYAYDNSYGISYDVPGQTDWDSLSNTLLNTWSWPISVDGHYSCLATDYTVTLSNGVCKIYYQGNLVKKIRA